MLSRTTWLPGRRGRSELTSPNMMPDTTLEAWPDGSRLAISFVIAFEQWKEDQVEPGRHVGPVLPPDARVRDHGSHSWQEYEGRAGLPRLMRVCRDYGICATGIFNTLAIEKFPALSREFAEAGHEICGHSYSQDTRMWRLAEDEERALITSCREVIQGHTGFRPCGWLSPGGQPSDSTRRLLAEEGYLYHSDLVDGDFPYWSSFGRSKILSFPYDWEVNDMAVYARGINPPSSYFDLFRAKFECLYAESTEHPMVLTFTAHSRLYGRPAGSQAVRRCIEFASDHSDVTFMTRRDIAMAYEAAARPDEPATSAVARPREASQHDHEPFAVRANTRGGH